MKIRFGINNRKVINGATLYLRIFQIASLLALPYIFLINIYPAVITSQNLWSVLFELGIVSIPRAEALLLSLRRLPLPQLSQDPELPHLPEFLQPDDKQKGHPPFLRYNLLKFLLYNKILLHYHLL